MRSNFLFSATLFHLLLIPACGWLLARHGARLAGRRRSPGLLPDLALLAGLAATLALVLGIPAPPSGFTTMRLLAQALFGEGPLLLLGLAASHLRKGQRTWAAGLGAATVLLLAVYVQAYHVEPRDLRVVRHEVDLRAGAAETGRLRIVHLSDIQTDRVGDHEERALRAALAEKPDLIVLTGDYIQPRLDDTRVQAAADLRALLRRLPFEAPLGVFAVQGDTDGRHWPGVLRDTPVRCLTSEVARVPLPGGRTLSLVGLSLEESRGDDGSALSLVSRAPAEDLRVVLGHRPDYVRTLAGRARVDLALAGHTHGGQIVLPGYGAPITLSRLPRRYASGLHLYEGLRLHVSPGVGMERLTAPQVRFFCPPEVSVLEVRY
jgi:predicted MPP superfamily phosphohydrolase